MKKILIALLVSFFLVGAVFAENDFVPHKKGDQAMLFEFSGLGFLFADAYNGGFGFKRFINDKTAVRGSLTLRNAKEKIPYDSDAYGDGTIGEDGSDKEFQFGVEVAGEIHRNNAKVDPYYGAGLRFNVIRTKYVMEVEGPQGSELGEYELKNALDGNAATSFSVFGILGVEYAINKVVSLAAEYNLGFRSTSEPKQVVTVNGEETETEGSKYSFFGITSAGILTLAIYL